MELLTPPSYTLCVLEAKAWRLRAINRAQLYSVVECLISLHKALGSIPGTTKGKSKWKIKVQKMAPGVLDVIALVGVQQVTLRNSSFYFSVPGSLWPWETRWRMSGQHLQCSLHSTEVTAVLSNPIAQGGKHANPPTPVTGNRAGKWGWI
jgi:hypothetical protein